MKLTKNNVTYNTWLHSNQDHAHNTLQINTAKNIFVKFGHVQCGMSPIVTRYVMSSLKQCWLTLQTTIMEWSFPICFCDTQSELPNW
jgi:succinate dehydrogenase hydrophobic anchor subunit